MSVPIANIAPLKLMLVWGRGERERMAVLQHVITANEQTQLSKFVVFVSLMFSVLPEDLYSEVTEQ